MTALDASAVLRYGNPAVECGNAWIRALSRQLATVVTVGGSIGAENLDRLTDRVRRFVIDEKPFILDLSAVESITVPAAQLLDAVSAACEEAGVEWATVAGDAVAALLGSARPVAESVPEALEHFAEANLRRRTLLLPMLSAKLTKSA